MFEKFIKFFISIIAIIIAYKIYSQIHNKMDSRQNKKDINLTNYQSKNTTLAKTSAPKIKISNKKIPKTDKNQALTNSLEDRLEALNAFSGDNIFIRIFKKEKILEVWIKPKQEKEYKLLKIYPICYYSGRLGPKLKEGDKQAPEGFYKVYKSSLNPNSRYHLSFNLGFPNRYDKAHNRTGSYLMVHGSCVSIGCYAMGDKNIEEIYQLVSDALYHGQKFVNVHIFPFKMEHLKNYKSNHWYSFWKNLKEGYDAFNQSKIPPKISVKNKKYIFY